MSSITTWEQVVNPSTPLSDAELCDLHATILADGKACLWAYLDTRDEHWLGCGLSRLACLGVTLEHPVEVADVVELLVALEDGRIAA